MSTPLTYCTLPSARTKQHDLIQMMRILCRAGTKRMSMKGANVRLPWNAKSRTRTRSDIEDEDGERTVAPFRPSAGDDEHEVEIEMSDI